MTTYRQLLSECIHPEGLLEKGDHWMQDAFKHPGRLHDELGVPKGEPIPKEVLDDAYEDAKRNGDTKMMKRITLARTGTRISRQRSHYKK